MVYAIRSFHNKENTVKVDYAIRGQTTRIKFICLK